MQIVKRENIRKGVRGTRHCQMWCRPSYINLVNNKLFRVINLSFEYKTGAVPHPSAHHTTLNLDKILPKSALRFVETAEKFGKQPRFLSTIIASDGLHWPWPSDSLYWPLIHEHCWWCCYSNVVPSPPWYPPPDYVQVVATPRCDTEQESHNDIKSSTLSAITNTYCISFCVLNGAEILQQHTVFSRSCMQCL